MTDAGDGVGDAGDGYPYRGFPRGWFQVAWSAELGVGDVRRMRYFGSELVAYRDGTGVVHVLDAHCPHLGAHLGYGGRVEGDCIRCPYHGWLFDGDGHNVEIPLTARVNRAVRIPTWTVHEVGGLVLVWHDPDRQPPSWDPPAVPEFLDDDRYDPHPHLTHLWPALKIRPQYIVENTVDVRHQQWVHGSRSEHELIEWVIDGPWCRSRQTLTFGAGREQTWLTPDGPVSAFLDVECWGIGFNVARFIGTDDSVHIGTHTPIDDGHIDERLTVLALRDAEHPHAPGPAALKRFEFEVRQVGNDIEVWEHMRYVSRPPFTSDEASTWRAFREWAASFYSSTQAGDRPPDGRSHAPDDGLSRGRRRAPMSETGALAPKNLSM